MNKTDIIAAVAAELELPKARVAAVVNSVLAIIVEKVAEGETVGITGFGTFGPRARAERQGRNPQTQEAITIPARTVPGFRPGRAFKEAVNS